MSGQESNRQYLENFVSSASPPRLRLMLIERGIEVAEYLSSPENESADELIRAGQMLRLREILGELLNGVTGAEFDVAEKVADLYVFLLQHLSLAEEGDDLKKWHQIVQVLQVERETWVQVCSKMSPQLEDSSDQAAPPAVVATETFPTTTSAAGSLNLQG